MEKKLWYAVMQGTADDDWNFGSYDLSVANDMVAKYKAMGYPDAYIAVIDEGTADNPADPICVREIR